MLHALTNATAKDLMRPDFLTLPTGKTVAEAVALMDKNNRGSVVLLGSHGELVGIFTERDLMRRVVAKGLKPKETTLAEVCTQKVVSVQTDTHALHLLELMVDHNFRHVPVLEGKKIVGMINLKQFYRFFLDRQQSMGV